MKGMRIVSDWTPIPLLMKALAADPTLSDEDRAWWADALDGEPNPRLLVRIDPSRHWCDGGLHILALGDTDGCRPEPARTSS